MLDNEYIKADDGLTRGGGEGYVEHLARVCASAVCTDDTRRGWEWGTGHATTEEEGGARKHRPSLSSVPAYTRQGDGLPQQRHRRADIIQTPRHTKERTRTHERDERVADFEGDMSRRRSLSRPNTEAGPLSSLRREGGRAQRGGGERLHPLTSGVLPDTEQHTS